MEKKRLPEDLLQELKCNLCGEYLSYPPITLHADTGSVCGRCPALEAERNIVPLREVNYEKLVNKFFLFPCRYQLQGCIGQFSLNDIPKHESQCTLKPFFCPVMPLGSCPWQGTPLESHMHFITEHQDMLLESNMFELDLINTYSFNKLLHQHDTLFLIHKEKSFDDGIFFCVIYQINNHTKKFEYLLEFKSGDGQKRFQVGEKQVPIYNDEISREHGFKVNVPIIRETLNSPMMITCTIDISESILEVLEVIDDEIHEVKDEEEVQEIVRVEDDKMLLDLECPVCQEFMIPPIYQCKTGHSVCGVCKPQLKECPSCRGPLADTRNFTLEKLTEHIMYQCKNRLDGCAHRANSKDIRKHEQECKFSPLRCPLEEYAECTWRGLNKAIISHVKIDHPDLILTEPFTLVINLEEEDEDEDNEIQKITRIFNEIFRIRVAYSHEKKKFYSTIQLVGSTDDAKKFMYEMSIVDLNKNLQNISSKRFCGGINDKKNDYAHCTVLPLDLVDTVSSENGDVEVRFKIFKL